MADITAVKIGGGVRWQLFEWSDVTEVDTPLELDVSGFSDPLLIFSTAGTFGGATISAGGGDVAGEAQMIVLQGLPTAAEISVIERYISDRNT